MMQKTACIAENQTKMGRKIYTRNESPISNDSMKCQKRTSLLGSILILGSPSSRAQWNVGEPGPTKASLPLRWGRVKGRTIHQRDVLKLVWR